MNLVYASFDLLFSELKNCSFGNELFFLLYNFIKSKDLIRIHEMILELDIKDFEFEELFGYFDFAVYFHEFFILNVVFLKLFHAYLRVHGTNAIDQS